MKKHLLLFFIWPVYLCAQNYADYVNPFIGTGGHGHTYPGATLPYGMVQLSPDTRIDGSWDGCSGYHFTDEVVYGFSHTHLSGTGCSDYGDVMLMPVTKKSTAFTPAEYSSRIDHTLEEAKAGFYTTQLVDHQVTANLTATTRTGFHQYIFHENEQAMVVLNLNHRDQLLDGEINRVNDHTISGYRYSKAWAQNQKIFFYIEFSRPIKSVKVLDDGQTLGELTTIQGKQLAANFFFDMAKNDTLLVKVGISGTGINGAKLNLQTENPGWNFTSIRKASKEAWNKELGKVEVVCEKKSDYMVFYSALYHTMVVPNIWNDVDGKYRGRDDQVHTQTEGNYYTVFSLWDTFRAAHPLYTLIDQQRTKDYVNTFISQFKDGGRLPVWELSSNETDCMIGVHSISVIADAVSKGLVNGQYKNVLADAMVATAGMLDYRGVGTMNTQQYLAIEDESESVSKTLEYCYQYACMATICKWAGRDSEARNFEWISLGYKNLFNKDTSFFMPRNNGGWLANFDPRQVNNNYTEANAWQYTFFVPHDINGMVELYGGKEKFHAKLDSLFGTNSKMTGREQADITGLIGQYAHGNEPSHHVAYLYNYVGDFKTTQNLVSKICDEFYLNTDHGLAGNEDCGQMSAWYVLSALGLYQVNPGSPYYTITTPQVISATVHLENGRLLSIQKDAGEIKSIWWNGEKLNRLYLSYEELMNGGQLRFETTGNTLAGDIQAGDILNTSSIQAPNYIAAPIIKISQPLFTKYTWVEIIADQSTPTTTFYTFTDNQGKQIRKRYNRKFKVKSGGTISAYGQFGLGGTPSPLAIGKCYKKPNNYSIDILSNANSQYFAGGAEGLLDGIYGDADWRKGYWHGYQEQDFVAVIDLKKEMALNYVACTFLQDLRSWILFPTKLSLFTSTDGVNFTFQGGQTEHADDKNEKVYSKGFIVNYTGPKVRYIKIVAENYGPLPKGHPGEGNPSFIFIDEIQIK